MLANIDVHVDGLTEVESLIILENIQKLIKSYFNLDLRRLSKIIVTTDLENEVNRLTNEVDKDFKSTYLTKNRSYAKVVILPNSNDFEMVLVLRNDFVKCLNHKHDGESLVLHEDAIHIFHHEMVHIHDNNKKIDAFPQEMRSHSYYGKRKITYPLAMICWSEYICNYISSESAVHSQIPSILFNSLIENIHHLRDNARNEILAFRTNKDINKLTKSLNVQIEALLKNAAYLIGYLQGLNMTIEQLSDHNTLELEKSFFFKTWQQMNAHLHNMRELYPDAWVSVKVFEELAHSFELLYERVGIKLLEDEGVISFEVVLH